MTVIAEVPAFKFKLDADALPLTGRNLALCFAVREASLNRLDQVTQFPGNHPKKEYDAIFVDRCMPQAAEVYGVAVCWAVGQFALAAKRGSNFLRR